MVKEQRGYRCYIGSGLPEVLSGKTRSWGVTVMAEGPWLLAENAKLLTMNLQCSHVSKVQVCLKQERAS